MPSLVVNVNENATLFGRTLGHWMRQGRHTLRVSPELAASKCTQLAASKCTQLLVSPAALASVHLQSSGELEGKTDTASTFYYMLMDATKVCVPTRVLCCHQ